MLRVVKLITKKYSKKIQEVIKTYRTYALTGNTK